MSRVTKARSRLALEIKHSKQAAAANGASEPQAVQDARRALAEEKIRQYVEQVVAHAPPLNPAQRDRLSALLHGLGS